MSSSLPSSDSATLPAGRTIGHRVVGRRFEATARQADRQKMEKRWKGSFASTGRLLSKRRSKDEKTQKLTQQRLAELAGVSTPTVSHFESGQKDLQLSTITSILGVLGMLDERTLILRDADPEATLRTLIECRVRRTGRRQDDHMRDQRTKRSRTISARTDESIAGGFQRQPSEDRTRGSDESTWPAARAGRLGADRIDGSLSPADLLDRSVQHGLEQHRQQEAEHEARRTRCPRCRGCATPG